MQGRSFALFDTVIGRCGVAWSALGLIGMQLPEAAPASANLGVANPGVEWARLRKRFPDAVETLPPPEIERVIERVLDLLAGGRDDLADIALDEAEASDFNRRVYGIARAIGPGKTSTYGEVAKALGDPGVARAVGKALGENPWPIVVPCHRVLAASGGMGGFSAPGGLDTKARLLTIERARTSAIPTLFDLEFSVAPPRVV